MKGGDMNVYCDFCGEKRCVALVDTNSRMVFRKDGIFEGVKTEKIENCPFRDETKIIKVIFQNHEKNGK